MRIILTLLSFLLLGLLLRGGGVWAQGIDYSARITGLENARLQKQLEQRSLLLTLADKKPATHSGLQRRIRNDTQTLVTELRNKGFYGAKVDVEQPAPETEGDPQKVILKVTSGPTYKIAELALTTGDADIDTSAGFAGLVEAAAGKPAAPGDILSIEQDAINALMQKGYPYPRADKRKLAIDHDSKTVNVTLRLGAGPKAHFGRTTITGLAEIEAPFITRRILWRDGDMFDIGKIARTRRKLQNTGVISAAEITYPPAPKSKDGRRQDNAADPLVLDIVIRITESKHRTIGGGLMYSTTRGPLANIYWERRNLFGQGEKLRLKLEGGANTLGFHAGLDKPDLFGKEELTWQNSVSLKDEELEAYDVATLLAKTSVNWQYAKNRALSAGVTFDRSDVSDTTIVGEDTYSIISVPLGWRMDVTSDLLDPRRGFRLNASLTPSFEIDTQDSFFTTEASASHYWPIGGLFGDTDHADRLVWANRVRAAAIWGQGLTDIPATYRLYAGGGGSGRGYGYQLIGPLDTSNTPTGGRSALGATTELRKKWENDFEGVIFFEGARVSDELTFSGSPGFLYSAGIGGRYHTVVGPVRLDVAFPLNKRAVDDAFQFYISIGQAF